MCDSRLTNLLTKLSDVNSLINLNATVHKLVTIVKGVANDNLVLNDRIKLIETSQDRLVSLMHSNGPIPVTSSNCETNIVIQLRIYK